MSEFKVSFFTNCYEADWETVLCNGRLSDILASLNFSFAFIGLIINNVKDKSHVEQYANQALKNGLITQYYFADDYAEKVLETFHIERKSFILDFHDGYWYSMGPLVSIYKCPTEYLLYFTCDCIIDSEKSSSWINEGIKKMKSDSTILTATALWSYDKGEAKKQSIKEEKDWYYGQGFSDQCFLVKKDNLYGPNYNEWHISNEGYPIYAGNLFERRVNGWMRCKGLLRIVSKKSFYLHEKIIDTQLPTTTVKKKICRCAASLSRSIRRNFKKRIYL